MRKFLTLLVFAAAGAAAAADDADRKAAPVRGGLMEMMQNQEFRGRDPQEIPAMRQPARAADGEANETEAPPKKKRKGKGPVPGGLREMVERNSKAAACPGSAGDDRFRTIGHRRRGKC